MWPCGIDISRSSLRCALSLIVIAAAGCAKTGAHSNVNPARTLTVGISTEPASLDPLRLQGTTSTMIGGLVYSYLLSVDKDGNPVPDAALDVPTLANGGISHDGLRISYHLRSGMRWPDGSAVTAADCIATYNAIVSPNSLVPTRHGYEEIASVTAPSARTIVVRLRRPYSPIVESFLSLPANYPILQARTGHDPGGSGPYRLVSWQRGDHITFAANAAYFRGVPKTPNLTFKFIPSDTTMMNELRTHEIDLATNINDPPLFNSLESIPGMRVVVTPVSGVMTLAFNTAQAPLNDPRVRRAIAQAIDTRGIVARASNGLYSAADPLRGMFAWAYRRSPALPYQPDAARTFFARRTTPLALSLAISSSSQMAMVLAVQVQRELQLVGVHVAIHRYAPAQFVAPASSGGPLFGGTFSLALLPIVFSPAGPDAGSYFICSQRMPAGFNYTRFCDARFDALYADSVRSYDRARQRRDSEQMQALLDEMMPQIPLYQLQNVAVIPATMRGFVPSLETPYVSMWQWAN